MARHTVGASRVREETDDQWMVGESLLAGLAVLLVATRYEIGGNIVIADPLAWLLAPLWLPVLRRYKGATTIFFLALGAMVSSWILTRYAAVDHRVSMRMNRETILVMASFLTSTGLLLWARERIKLPTLFLLFGIGMLIDGPSNMKLYATNAWKFGFSLPLTVALIGYVSAKGRSRLTLALVAVFGVLCALNDARSNLAQLLLTLLLVLWRVAANSGRTMRRRRNPWGTLGLLAGLAVVAYYTVQALILDGALGAETQARSQEQLRTSGSLLLGGRPEFGASTALFAERPWGFGGGTYLNTHDLWVAKNGMLSLGYDPNNGYVHRFMFGRGIELHSMVFDLWAWFGLLGLLLAIVLGIQLLASMAHALDTDPIRGTVVVFCALSSLWNLLFSPWYASIPLLVLVLGVGLVRRREGGLRRGALEE